MTKRLAHIDRPDAPSTDKSFQSYLSSSSFAAIALQPFMPTGQSDLALLGGAGLVILLIVILLIIVIVLLFVIRARSKKSKRKLRTDQPSSKVRSGAGPENPPGPSPPAESVAVPPGDGPTTSPAPPPDPAVGVAEPGVKPIDEPETMPVSGRRPASIRWQIAGLTDLGLKRRLNEDSLIMIETETSDSGPCGLYVVADGLGGHESGEIASKITINAIQSHFTRHSPGPTEAAIEAWLNEAVMAANATVISRQKDRLKAKKMGSTLVMALITGGKAHIANVGDSRAYRLSQDTIQQISVDHSLVERLIEIGQITREEARTHKQRNVIYSTIGDKAKLQVGFYHVGLQPGDRLLLCSDGLTGVLTDEQILNISRSHSNVVEACQDLVKAANTGGGDDNITVILIEMEGE